MPVSVDNVYQKVLALANKEQRGYVTPQEFNLLADRAQSEIFEGYFHDLKTAVHKPGNQTEQSDEVDMLAERIAVHRNTVTLTAPLHGVAPSYAFASNLYTIPGTVHKLMTVYGATGEATEVNQRDLHYILTNDYTAPSANRVIYVRRGADTIQPYPFLITGSGTDDAVAYAYSADIIEKPATPAWGYVVVSEKPLYNANTTTDFDLHASEEEKLVTKILELAGIVINKPGLAQTAANMEQRAKVEENN